MVASVRPSVQPLAVKVDIRGAALPSALHATKSEEESLSVQEVCLCV